MSEPRDVIRVPPDIRASRCHPGTTELVCGTQSAALSVDVAFAGQDVSTRFCHLCAPLATSVPTLNERSSHASLPLKYEFSLLADVRIGRGIDILGVDPVPLIPGA